MAGKKLKIPQKGYKIYPTAQAKPHRATQATTHTVKSGDSLWILAKKYNTSVKKIQALNGMKDARLHINQVLKIPGTETTPMKTGDKKSRTYRVRRGDSPYSIALQHNIPLKRFLKINDLTPRSTIYPGQMLYME